MARTFGEKRAGFRRIDPTTRTRLQVILNQKQALLRHAVEARARVTSGVRRTAVLLPIGWGERQQFHPWRPVNYLTDKTQRCPISEQTNLKSLLCRVRAA